jgi:hypothetical protein
VEWDVDFVCISFGLIKHSQNIRESIENAMHHRKERSLSLRPAANDGCNSRGIFPANLGDPVILVRCTHRSGAFEPDYNPPRSLEELVGA